MRVAVMLFAAVLAAGCGTKVVDLEPRETVRQDAAPAAPPGTKCLEDFTPKGTPCKRCFDENERLVSTSCGEGERDAASACVTKPVGEVRCLYCDGVERACLKCQPPPAMGCSICVWTDGLSPQECKRCVDGQGVVTYDDCDDRRPELSKSRG